MRLVVRLCVLALLPLLLMHCKKDPALPPPPPNIPDPAINQVYPSHGPWETKVAVVFDRYMYYTPPQQDPQPTRLLVAGVSIPFTIPTATDRIEFIVPKGMKSGAVQIEWKGKLINGPEFTYDSLYYVSTVAGMPAQPGYVNGPAATARFYRPFGIAVDQAGNIYVSEKDFHRVRKISASGEVTLLAGSETGQKGYAEGTGSAALFDEPFDLAADNNGNVYVSDCRNGRVRKISSSGQTSVYMGIGYGNFEGDSNTASISTPWGLDIDNQGNLYLVAGYQLVKISTARQLTIIAGNLWNGDAEGTGQNAYFSNPLDVTAGDNGDMFICDNGRNKIWKVTPAGVTTNFAGMGSYYYGFANGNGMAARFYNPASLVFSNNTVFVLEPGNEVVRSVSLTADVNTFAGVPTYFGHKDGVAGRALFNEARGIATDKKGNFYIADTRNHCIRKISKE